MIATGSERYQNTPTTNKRFPEHIGGSKYADADHCYLLPFLFISSSRMLFLSPHFIVRIINGPYIRSFLYYPLRLCLFSLLILFLFFFLLLCFVFVYSTGCEQLALETHCCTVAWLPTQTHARADTLRSIKVHSRLSQLTTFPNCLFDFFIHSIEAGA